MDLHTIKHSFKESIPVMMGYLFLGFAFGVLLASNGYPVIYALIMSVCIYAGSMQFVAISLLSGGASILNTLLMTLMINARHIFYGLSMLEKFDACKELKPYMIFSLTDETYSLLVKTKCPKDCNEKLYMFFIALFNQMYWIIGGLIGSIFGSTIHFDATGLDFSMTALFVVIVVEQYRHSKQHIPTYIGFIMSIISLLIFGPDQFIIPAMLGILTSLLLVKKYKEVVHE